MAKQKPIPLEAWEVEWEAEHKRRARDAAVEIAREATPDGKKRPASRTAIGPGNLSLNSVEAMVEYLRTPRKKRDASVLDNMIINNGLDDVPLPEIARMVGMPVSEVRKRYLELLKDNYSFSQEEMKLILTAKLHRVANMMTEMAQKGSEKHAGIILESIKQLREMYDLLSSNSNITIEVITVEQTNILVTTLGYIIEKFKEDPRVQGVIDGEVFEAIGAEALGEAAELIFQAQDREVVLDSKGVPV